MWDIDTLDWNQSGVTALSATPFVSTKPGAIVLMHDGGGDREQTVAALPMIIDDLKAQGYTFVTLDELAVAK